MRDTLQNFNKVVSTVCDVYEEHLYVTICNKKYEYNFDMFHFSFIIRKQNTK